MVESATQRDVVTLGSRGIAGELSRHRSILTTVDETCARGPYTDFCGYFYVPRSQRIS